MLLLFWMYNVSTTLVEICSRKFLLYKNLNLTSETFNVIPRLKNYLLKDILFNAVQLLSEVFFHVFVCDTYDIVQTLKMNILCVYHRSISWNDKSFIDITMFNLYQIQVIYKVLCLCRSVPVKNSCDQFYFYYLYI